MKCLIKVKSSGLGCTLIVLMLLASGTRSTEGKLADQVSAPVQRNANQNVLDNFSIDDLYKAISYAETGGETDPWIRTKVRPAKGSTAFGPAQLTGSTAALYTDHLSPESLQFYNDVMAPLYNNFSTYGGDDMIPGKEMYDYGKSGNFDTAEYADDYERMVKEMMAIEASNLQGKPLDAFVHRWRFGQGNEGSDPAYFNRVNTYLTEVQSGK